MQRYLGTAALLSCLLATSALAAGEYPFRVVLVVDGDTLYGVASVQASVSIDSPTGKRELRIVEEEPIRVRVAGVNAPEVRGACQAEKDAAQRARVFVEQFVAGGGVRVLVDGADKYGRLLGDVRDVGGRLLSMALLNAELVDPYDGGRRDPQRWCR